MSILTANGIVVRYNDRVVLNGVTFAINEQDRVGLVGRNGSGKSTLLRILSGLQEADSGEITKRRGLRIGYLSQQFSLEPNLTVEENIRGGAQHMLDLIREFESLPAESSRHHELEQQILTHDGWHLDTRIAIAMDHLHCPGPERAVGSLSGGEQRRVALCRAIIAEPDLLILDEPTNHLDTESIEWLGEFLENYRGAFLLVTHDRYFLDRITNNIAELSNGTMYTYTGNYTDYLISKAEREAGAEVTEHKRQMFLRRELEWVRRGPKARTTKSKSRLDRYFEVAKQAAPEIDQDVDLVIPPPPPPREPYCRASQRWNGTWRQATFLRIESELRSGTTRRNFRPEWTGQNNTAENHFEPDGADDRDGEDGAAHEIQLRGPGAAAIE